MHERIRDILLGRWGHFVASHPKLTLSLCALLAAGSVVLTATGLEFRADRSELIDPQATWNKQYVQYKENFPHANDVYVVLDGARDDAAIDDLARTIARGLRADSRVAAADAGFDLGSAGAKFFALAGREQFDRTLDELATARRIVAAPDANAALGVLLADLSRQQGDPGALDRLDQFLAPYLAAAHDTPADFDFLVPTHSNWQPLASSDGAGRLRFVRVRLDEHSNGVNGLGSTLTRLRQSVASIVAQSPQPRTDWGITGIPAIESDETTQAIEDTTIASVLAIALITLVMFVAFRGLTVPLLAAGALLIGMTWSFGWLIISVGHLQLLSVVFSVILLGLGIDFALLFVSRLELVQDEHADLASATARVFRGMGPGMVTGAVTTAAAFAAVALTSFRGMAEMGIIAAGGILLCLIAVLSAFPALLALTGRWKRIIRHRPGGETAHFARGRLDLVDRYPLATLLLAGAVVIGLVWMAQSVSYDPNVLNLQSANVESVKWEKRIADEDARSVWSAVVVASPEQAPQLADRLRQAPGVSDIGAMGMLFPPDRAERRQLIAELRTKTIDQPRAEGSLTGVLGQLTVARVGLLLRARSVPPDVKARLTATAVRIAESVNAAQQLTATAQSRAWGRLNDEFLHARDQLADWLDAALADRAPGPWDLPAVLRDPWVGKDGSWLLLVYPDADEQQRSILAPDRLGPFVESMRAALAGTGIEVIGPPVQIYESSELIKKAYILAACYAIGAILVLLLLDFRRLADALCSMTPVTIGFVGAFGVMGLFGVPLNFANMIILPILFGIGVNAGVHMVHRWRAEPFGRPAGLSGATGRGITLTMLTTMIGFGCLLLAQHRGIRSLGFVMVIGLGMTLLACYTVLPAVLRWRTRAVAQAVAEPRGETLRAARLGTNRHWQQTSTSWRKSA